MHLEFQADLTRLSTRARQIMAPHSGHMIHQDEPEVVVASIRELVETVRAGGARQESSDRNVESSG